MYFWCFFLYEQWNNFPKFQRIFPHLHNCFFLRCLILRRLLSCEALLCDIPILETYYAHSRPIVGCLVSWHILLWVYNGANLFWTRNQPSLFCLELPSLVASIPRFFFGWFLYYSVHCRAKRTPVTVLSGFLGAGTRAPLASTHPSILEK